MLNILLYSVYKTSIMTLGYGATTYRRSKIVISYLLEIATAQNMNLIQDQKKDLLYNKYDIRNIFSIFYKNRIRCKKAI